MRPEEIRLENGFTPLLQAVVEQKTYEVRHLAQESDPSLSRLTGEWHGYNAIHICAYYDNSIALQAICEARYLNFENAINAYIERKNGKFPGYTPLLIASHYQYPSIVRLLIKNGADPSLTRASYNGSEWEWYAYNAFHISVYNRDVMSLMALCESTHPKFNDAINAYIDRTSGELPGFTPLLMAARYKFPEIVKMLVRRGADPSLCRNKEGDWYAYNATHISVYNNDEISLREICQAQHLNLSKAMNARIDRKGGEFPQYTPLLMSTYNKYPNLTKILMEYGADPSLSESAKGYNAIHMCVSNNDDKSLGIICRSNSDKLGEAIMAKNSRGETPLVMAATYGYTEIVKLLEETLIRIAQLATPSPVPELLNSLSPLEVNKSGNQGQAGPLQIDPLFSPPPAPPLTNSTPTQSQPEKKLENHKDDDNGDVFMKELEKEINRRKSKPIQSQPKKLENPRRKSMQEELAIRLGGIRREVSDDGDNTPKKKYSPPKYTPRLIGSASSSSSSSSASSVSFAQK